MTSVKTVLPPAEAVRVLPETTYTTGTPAEVSAGRALVLDDKPKIPGWSAPTRKRLAMLPVAIVVCAAVSRFPSGSASSCTAPVTVPVPIGTSSSTVIVKVPLEADGSPSLSVAFRMLEKSSDRISLSSPFAKGWSSGASSVKV